MNNPLKLDQNINIEGTIYKVIGIDIYNLINIYEKRRDWLSYTLVDITNKENRIWLGYGFADNYFIKQWIIPEEEFKKNTETLPLNAEYTGVANITFKGEQGYSVPNSEIIWFNSLNDQYDFFVIERFVEIEKNKIQTSKSYYHGMKILQSFKV
jgi:hypothetical protein